MKIWLSCIVIVMAMFVSLFVPAAKAESVEDLYFMEIPSVVTASKTPQSIDKAPSVMTVVTSEDIKRMGARSPEDVLRRVVGFYPTTSNDWEMIGNRGVTADSNYLYLFLIDGHSINSINGWGASNQQILPSLAYIDRIEIIRGPGSTMWGTDAVMGTINFITKKGSQVKGLQTSVAWSNLDNQFDANTTLGGETSDKTSYLASLTYSESDGYHQEGKPNNTWHAANNFTPGNIPTEGSFGNYEAWGPTYDFYGKVNSGPFTIQAKTLHFVYNPASANAPVNATNAQVAAKVLGAVSPETLVTESRITNNSFLEVSYLKDINSTTSLETKIFTDSIDKSYYPNSDTNLTAGAADQEYKENGIGADVVLRKTFAEQHHVQLGARADITDVGLNTTGLFNPATDLSAANPPTGKTTPLAYYFLTPSGTDHDYAAYLEDQWDITKKLDVILGARVDADDMRENSTKIVPRFGIIYALTESLTAKYLYNSGYFRPAINQSQRLPSNNTALVRNASKSINTYSQDLQLMYNTKEIHSSLTFYIQTLDNYIINVSNKNRAGVAFTPAIAGGYANIGDVQTEGVELEASKKVAKKLEVYGNYAYSVAKLINVDPSLAAVVDPIFTDIGNQQLLAFPQYQYNLGINWDFMKDDNLNLHVRGNGSAEIQLDKVNNITLDGESYLDAAVLFEKIANTSLDLTVFCTNLLDNEGQDPEVMGSYSWKYAEGRNLGFEVGYKF
jgi:iron complex outermembrane receptor protein